MIATAAAGDRTAVAKLARQARVLHPQLLRVLPRMPCLAQPYSHCGGDFNTLYACITPVSPTLRLGKVGWSRSPMADAVVAPSVPCFEEFGSCRRQGFDGSRLNSHLCGQETLAQPTFPSARYIGNWMEMRFKRWLKACGFSTEVAEDAAARFVRSVGAPSVYCLAPEATAYADEGNPVDRAAHNSNSRYHICTN